MGPWSSSTPQNFCGGAPIGKKCSGSQITLWNCKVLRPIDPRDNTANFPHSLPLEFLGLCFFGIIANFELWFHNLFGCWWLEYSWEFELKSNWDFGGMGFCFFEKFSGGSVSNWWFGLFNFNTCVWLEKTKIRKNYFFSNFCWMAGEPRLVNLSAG